MSDDVPQKLPRYFFRGSGGNGHAPPIHGTDQLCRMPCNVCALRNRIKHRNALGSHLIAQIGEEKRLFDLVYELEAELKPMANLENIVKRKRSPE